MPELSLHILDIVQNSISAQASLINITIIEDINNDKLEIKIDDNGVGMSKDFLAEVTNPFKTSRTTRKVGLGLSLFKQAANACEGDLFIDSTENIGTNVKVVFKHSHIDRMPLGNMAQTIAVLITGHAKVDFRYEHIYESKTYVIDSREIKAVLGEDVDINNSDVFMWIVDNVEEGIRDILKINDWS